MACYCTWSCIRHDPLSQPFMVLAVAMFIHDWIENSCLSPQPWVILIFNLDDNFETLVFYLGLIIEIYVRSCVSERWLTILWHYFWPILMFLVPFPCFHPCFVLWHYVQCFVVLSLFISIFHSSLPSEFVLSFYFVAINSSSVSLPHVFHDFVLVSCLILNIRMYVCVWI